MRTTLVLFSLFSVLTAAVITESYQFSPAQFQFEERGGFTLIDGAGMELTDTPGAPQLPSMPLTIQLPGRARVNAVSFRYAGWQTITEAVRPFPAQRQLPLVVEAVADGVTGPDPAVYESTEPWPAQVVRWTGTAETRQGTVVHGVITPLRWTGADARLELCSRVSVRVEYELLSEPPALNTGAFDYLIVTGAGFDTVFARLAAWKTQKGVPAVVRDIGWVLARYPGRDDAEKLRNYLKTVPDSGCRYVLLGGDVDVVPFRKAFAMACEWGAHPREDSLPCDLYFAALDGDWDRNGNGVFGETDDSVDLAPELSVGRAPCDRLSEAQAFVNKTLDYELGMAAHSNGLFAAEILWQNPYTDQGVHKDRLDDLAFGGWYNLTKLYQSRGNQTRESVLAAIRAGQNFINHDGHGWIDVMSVGGGPANRLRTADADTITNDRRGVIYSIGCWTTAFDFASIGEAFVTNPNGGTVATIGNSSYGWGSPGNPGFGYSDKFDDRFWYSITRTDSFRLGDALAAAKARYAPYSHDRNVYRWHQYQLNLMGDPELGVWTREPESLRVSAPEVLGPNPGRVLVTVRRGGVAEPGALVCLSAPDRYARAQTNAAGEAWLDLPAGTGAMTLTVTARNCYPLVRSIPVRIAGHLNLTAWLMDDAAGNNDGVLNPLEEVTLSVGLRNAGSTASGPWPLVLRSSDPTVNVLDSTAVCPALAPGESTLVAAAFRVEARACAQDGRIIEFELAVQDTDLAIAFRPVLQMGLPRLKLERHVLLRPPLSPGQSGAVRLAIQNRGHGWGHAVSARLVSLDPYVTVETPGPVNLGEMPPLRLTYPADSFGVSVSGACPGSYLAPLRLELESEIWQFVDTFRLLVGEYGFADDIESGDRLWSHGGTGDLWHISTYRANSGGHSWYCGDPNTSRYNSAMNAWLMTVPLIAAENCSLSFWRWFRVPNYGVDGIYVIVMRSGREDTLDFLGTGGALGEPLDVIESDWCEERYALDWLAPGETIRVKLSFKSDTDTTDEGFYIDDVRVTGGGAPLVAVRDWQRPAPTGLRLSAGPSPFRARLNIRLETTTPTVVQVFDATGRAVATFPVRPGPARFCWDARDLAPGAYFIAARTSSATELLKVILTR